jgi:DUF4097 and DUF4098 domain-containing protein YvlB
MKKKEIVIIVLLIVFGFIYNAFEKGKIRWTDDFSRYFNERRLVSEQFVEFPQAERVFPAPGKITITNPAGEIHIDKSTDDQVHLSGNLKVYYSDRADVEKISRNVLIQAENENDELKVSAAYASAFPYQRLRIRLDLLVPDGVTIHAGNSEGIVSVRHGGKNIFLRQENGNVILADIPSSVEVEIRNGDLDVKNIAGNIAIDARQSDIVLENVSALQVTGRHGNYSLKKIKTTVFIEHAYGELTLDGAEQAEISGRHSKIEVRNIKNGVRLSNAFQSTLLEHIDGDVHLESRSSEMKIRHVNAKNMVVENSFADIAIADYAGENVNIILRNGNLIFQGKNISDRLNIESRQANIELVLGPLADPTFNIKTSHGRITNQSSLDLELFGERDESFANRSGQKPEIIIHNSYGDIHIK